jgi:formate-dependent phosphoribosylglycinamide formyltransferase (GAR transformylase)
VAPFLAEHVPVCIGGCVFQDGGVTLHTPSFQVIGIPACSRYDFGYCGNDFGAIAQLSETAMKGIETCVRTAGVWLHAKGYVGAFGVDAIVRDDEVVFVEINPRFLGSSRVSAELDAAMDLPDVYFDHLMACLGLPSYASPPLAEQAAIQPARSQLLCLNLRQETLMLRESGMDLPAGFSAELVPKSTIRVGPEYLLFRLRANDSVTKDGKSVSEAAANAIEAGLAAFTSA